MHGLLGVIQLSFRIVDERCQIQQLRVVRMARSRGGEELARLGVTPPVNQCVRLL